MVMKKVMVGCLIASLLIGGNGVVLASSLDAGTGVLDTNSGEVLNGNVVYSTHVQNVGWQDKVADGKMSGTEGRSLRLEGITIESGIEGGGIEYLPMYKTSVGRILCPMAKCPAPRVCPIVWRRLKFD